MRYSIVSAMALLASVNAASDSTITSAPTTTVSATATGSEQSTITSVFRVPYLSGLPLAASVINSKDDAITYKVGCDTAHTVIDGCGNFDATAIVISNSTYSAWQTAPNLSAGYHCVVQTSGGLSCEATASTVSMTQTEYSYSDDNDTKGVPITTYTEAGFDGSVGNVLTVSSSFASSELSDLTVRITGGLEKLSPATATTTTAGSEATKTSGNGIPKVTGSANLLAGGALAALALVF